MSMYPTPTSLLEMASVAAKYKARLESRTKQASTLDTVQDPAKATDGASIPTDKAADPKNQATPESKKNDGKGQDQAFKPAETPATQSGNAVEDANKQASMRFQAKAAQVMASIRKSASTSAPAESAAQGGNAQDPKLKKVDAKIPTDPAADPALQAALRSLVNEPQFSADGDNLEKKARELFNLTPELYRKVATTILASADGQQALLRELDREVGVKAASALIEQVKQAAAVEAQIKQAAEQQAVVDVVVAVKQAAEEDAAAAVAEEEAAEGESGPEQIEQAIQVIAAAADAGQIAPEQAAQAIQELIAPIQEAAQEQAAGDTVAAVEEEAKEAAVRDFITITQVQEQAKQAAVADYMQAAQVEQAKAASVNYHHDIFTKLAGAASPEEQAAMAEAYDQGADQADAMAEAPEQAVAAAEQEPSLEEYIAVLQQAVASGQISEEEATAVLQQAIAQLQQAGAAQ